MAAIDLPWLDSMSKSSTYTASNGSLPPQPTYDSNPPTVAAFAPRSSSGYSATAKQRSTIIVHKKSPLLVATPPQITRALAHSHPFILVLNKFVALVSWSTDDAWESFLLVAAFWLVTLYGGTLLRYAGPPLGVAFLIAGMYSRRYSPLSSTSKTGEKHDSKRRGSDGASSQHKSLDEIVETMQQFTIRCNMLLEPFISMTDFLSTQRTPTSATTRPALTTLFIRILLVTPVWVSLTLPPLYILTPRRVILTLGTLILTFHSRPARVSRVILWRSIFLRRSIGFITGLKFDTEPSDSKSVLPQLVRSKSAAHLHAKEFASSATKRRTPSSGIRFTFILYENQRRWIGLGWTTSLFAYERAPWTDEHLNPAPSKDEFELPDVEGGQARWRWVKGSSWQIEGTGSKRKGRHSASKLDLGSKSSSSNKDADQEDDGGSWIYYDNKWNDGRVEDGWGRYTRRRKWHRDAELVEVISSIEASPAITPAAKPKPEEDYFSQQERIRQAKEFALGLSNVNMADSTATIVPEKPLPFASPLKEKEDDAGKSPKKKSGWFNRGNSSRRERSPPGSKASSKANSLANSVRSKSSQFSRDGPDDDVLDKWRDSSGKNIGGAEDLYMGLG